MSASKISDCENNRLQKLIAFRLPKYFYTIGMAVVALSIVMMFVRAFAMEGETEWLKLVLQKVLVVGLLLMSIARDKDEDELVIKLRMQSYTYGFITGVFYALILPFVELGVSNAVHSGGEVYKDLGDFQVLLFMLMVQLMCFHMLKKMR